MGKTALVIGATGMVGKELVEQLLINTDYSSVILFGRNSISLKNPKLTEHLINFEQPEMWKDLVKGDVLFSSLGTTLRAAGSKVAQYKVDYEYQFTFAALAAANGVENYILVSSVGANPGSPFFYLRMKGELEEDILKLPFRKISILRPSQLYGRRIKKRPQEEIAVKATSFLNKIGILKNRKPISAKTLAKAMIVAAQKQEIGTGIFTANEIFFLACE